MIKLMLTKKEYDCIINNTKDCLATYDDRPILKAINIKIEDNRLTAVAVDGFRLAKTEFDLTEKYENCNFMFTPEKIDKKTELIIIEQDNDFTIVKQLKENSVMLETKHPIINGDFIDYNKILEWNDYSNDYASLSVNSKMLAEMLKNIKCEDYNNSIEILIPKENKSKPLFIKYKNKETKGETLKLLLPIRS